MSLPRKTGLPPRQKPMRRASKGLCAQKRAQRRAYAAAPDADQVTCSACHYCRPLEHSHILPQGRYPEHRNNPLNWLLLCSDCHRMWENNKLMFSHRWPEAYAEKLRRMGLVDAQAHAFFLLKNPAPARSL